jgi:hypothetical protein
MRRDSRINVCLLFAALSLRAAPAAHAACGTTATAVAGVSTIQSAVASAATQLTAGDHCVSITGGTYNEQVIVQNIVTNGFRIVIGAVPGTPVIVSPPVGSQGAFVIANDSVTIAGVNIQTANPMPYGVYVSSNYVAISSVNIVSPEGNINSAGIVLGSYGQVSNTYVEVLAAHALSMPGSQGTSVSYSIFETTGAAQYALYLVGASGNRFTGLFASNMGGRCAFLTGQSASNTIDLSTFTGGLGGAGVYFDGGSGNSIQSSVLNGGGNIAYGGDAGPGLDISGGVSNTVASSILTGGTAGEAGSGGSGATLEASANFNTVSLSTLTGGAGGQRPAGYLSSGGHGLLIYTSQSNTVAQSVLSGNAGGICAGGGGGPGGHGLYVNQGSNNAVTQSLLTGGTGGGGEQHLGGLGGYGAFLSASSLNTISRSQLYGGPGGFGKGGPGLVPGNGGDGFNVSGGGSNVINNSLMSGAVGGTGDTTMGGGGGNGFTLSASASNTISQSMISGGPGAVSWSGGAFGANGYGAELLSNANSNTVSLSTITSAGCGLDLTGASNNAVVAAYVQGSSAVVISACAGTSISSSVLTGTSAYGGGVWLTGGSSGLTLTLDSVRGGSQAAGIFLDNGNSGTINVSSTSFQGSHIGLAIAPQASTASLSIASLNFSRLSSPGAVGIDFLGGVFAANLPGIDFADASVAVNVDASLLAPASRITMTNAQGPRAGASFANDPQKLVSWTSSNGTPGLPIGTALGASSITWTWTAAAGAVGYNFYPSTGGPAIALTGAALTQAGLSTNTAYGARVSALNAGGEGPLTAAATAYTLATPPTNAALKQVQTSSITLSWSANTNPPGTQYQAQLWTTGGATTTLTLTGLTTTFTMLSPQTTYYLGLAAINGNGFVTPAAVILTTTTLPGPLSSPPPTPTGLMATALGLSSMTWTWSAVFGATGYNFYPSTGGPAITLIGAALTQAGLSTNTAYGARVSALNAGGESPLTAAATTYTLAAAPMNAALTQVQTSSITLSWSANSNPPGTQYQAQLWTAGGATTTLTLTGLTTAFTMLSPQTTYYLGLAAINDNGFSTPAAVILTTATLPGPLHNPPPTLSINVEIGPRGGTIVFDPPAGLVTVIIPPNAFAQATNLTLSLPAGFPSPTTAALTDAGTGVGVQITADQPIQPGAVIVVSVTYRPSDVARPTAGNLSLASYDETRGLWVPLVSNVDTTHLTVTCQTDHFSIYQIMQVSASSTVDTAKAFPNPFRPSQGQTSMTFENLPAGSRLRIYDFLGSLVRDLTTDASGMASWDGTNQSGRKAASGTYFAFAQGAGGHTTFKVAIQR